MSITKKSPRTQETTERRRKIHITAWPPDTYSPTGSIGPNVGWYEAGLDEALDDVLAWWDTGHNMRDDIRAVAQYAATCEDYGWRIDRTDHDARGMLHVWLSRPE